MGTNCCLEMLRSAPTRGADVISRQVGKRKMHAAGASTVYRRGNGIYRLWWKSGGSSLAAVGSLHSGTRWFAPTNWTASVKMGIVSTEWRKVERVDQIA